MSPSSPPYRRLDCRGDGRLTVNFMLFALAALNFPLTTTSQPLAPLSMMNLNTP